MAISDANTILKDLVTAEYDGVNYLYNLESKPTNLFLADPAFFSETASLVGNPQFRVNKFSFKLPTLSFEFKNRGQQPVLKDIKYCNDIAITWVEDVYDSISVYHQKWWQKAWFDRSTGRLKNSPDGKTRDLQIWLFHYLNVSNKASPFIEPSLQLLACLKFKGLRPTEIDAPAYGMGEDGNPLIQVHYAIDAGETELLGMADSDLWQPNAAETAYMKSVVGSQASIYF